MNRPFHVVVGSQSSALIFESEVGVNSSLTRQYSGSGGGAGAGGAAWRGAARGRRRSGRRRTASSPAVAAGGGVTTSTAEMVTFGIDIDTQAVARGRLRKRRSRAANRPGELPSRALSFMFMVCRPLSDSMHADQNMRTDRESNRGRSDLSQPGRRNAGAPAFLFKDLNRRHVGAQQLPQGGQIGRDLLLFGLNDAPFHARQAKQR